MVRVYTIITLGFLCFVVACLVYVNTLDCGFVYDDAPAIEKNQDLRPHTPWYNLFLHDFWGAPIESETSHKSYRPLCVATFRLNYLLHELRPRGYHLVNMLLHGAVCFLYVQLCGVLFSESCLALIAGVLFAVHPIHTEAVAGLVGRTELLSGIFYIGTILTYRKAAQHKTGFYWWLAVSMLSWLCSCLSKEQGITSVAVCVTYDFLVLHKMDLKSTVKLLVTLRSCPRKSPSWFRPFVLRTLVLAVFTVGYLAFRILLHGGQTMFEYNRTINPPVFMDTPYRQLSWMYLCFENSRLLLSPFRLSADWRFGAVPLIESYLNPRNMLAMITLVAFGMLAWFGLNGNGKRHKVVLLGVALIVFPYLPASNLFFPVGFVVAERVLYLPSMGSSLLVAYGLCHLFQATKSSFYLPRSIACFIILLMVLYTGKTLQRNRDWYSNMALYSAGVKFNPNNGLMLSSLASEYAHLKNYSYAEELYRTAIAVAPHYSRGYANLGGLMEALKRYDEAEWAFRKAVEFGTSDTTPSKVVQTYVFLIEEVILHNSSRVLDALELCDRALRDYPSSGPLFTTKGNILLRLNQPEKAIAYLEPVVQSNLRLPDSSYYLGVAYARVGKSSEAEVLIQAVLAVNPSHKGALVELGKLLCSSKNPRKLEEAEQLLLRAIRLHPHCPDATLALAKLYGKLGNVRKSTEFYRRGLKLSPSNTDALSELGNLYLQSGRYGEAVEVLQRLTGLDSKYPNAHLSLRQAERLMNSNY